MRWERLWAPAASAAVSVALVVAPNLASAQNETSPAQLGSFSAPFSEPTIDGHPTPEKCIEENHGEDPHFECKPAAGSMAVLPTGDIVYFNALEGTENIGNGTATEFGKVSINDQSRLLDLDGPTWSIPSPADAGANPGGYEPPDPIPGGHSTETYNDGALFCAAVEFLADGRLLAVGGTAYYNEPGNDDLPYGVAELEGLPNARIYNPQDNTWSQSGSMKFGRWYPSMVTLGDGHIFVASGVQKLIKPVYPNHPEDSGRNVVQTETYDPNTGEWSYNGAGADRSLPLYPRLHLLPNGQVYYDAAGQVFNPMGQSYDEASWNVAAAYDPASKAWTDLGIPGLGTLAPGFRGSSFSLMLPLRADEDGHYTKAEFLSAGGTVGVTPGSYLSAPTSNITTIDTAGGMSLATRATGMLKQSRWYSTGVVLPTGQVTIFSGASRDEVVGPGTGEAITEAELFDPKTETWSSVASAHQGRTYHNTAALLPDGRVLVGGHAPIPTLYGAHMTLPGMSPNEGRDPTFEIYSPPYLFWGERPEITKTPTQLGYGGEFKLAVKGKAAEIESVMLVRNTSITHLVDGDQRTVDLQVIARHGHKLTVSAPPDGDVAPPGPYMLFVNRSSEKGLIPSTAAQVLVSG